MLSEVVIAALRRRRLDRGLSAAEVAELAGAAGFERLTQQAIMKLESGIHASFTLEEFLAWCAVLDADPVLLLQESGVGEGTPPVIWEVRRTWMVRARSWDEAVSLAAEGRHSRVEATCIQSGKAAEQRIAPPE